MPDSIRYDSSTETLHVGQGQWTGVSLAVREYTVGGANVIDSWTGYRLAKPKGKRTSPLDNINVTTWPAEWSIELSELLSVLTQLVDLESDQQTLLDQILAGGVLTTEELATLGVQWPDKHSTKDRKPRKSPTGGLLD